MSTNSKENDSSGAPIVIEGLTAQEKMDRGMELTLNEKRSIAGRMGGLNNYRDRSERRVAFLALRRKIIVATDVLFQESMHNAVGRSFLYKIEKIEKKGKKGKKGASTYQAQRPILVTNPAEIEEYLTGLIDNGDLNNNKDPASVYHYITTERGDQRAIDSMLDRAYGKSTQVVQTEDEDGNRQALQGNNITFVKQNVNRN